VENYFTKRAPQREDVIKTLSSEEHQMRNAKEMKLTKTLQVKYQKYIKKITQGFSVPEQKFINHTVFGILSSRSCIVRKVSQSLKETISLKKTSKRLSYHLSKDHFDAKLSDNLLRMQSNKLNEESIVIADPGDIMKTYAQKMEGLSSVRDGSKGEWCKGYDILDFIAADIRCDNTLKITPLVSDLYSAEMEEESLKTRFFNRVNDIQVYSNNTCIFTVDRGYDDKKVIAYFYRNDARFIIRSKGVRDVYYKGEKMSFSEVSRKVEMPYTFTRRSRHKQLIAGAVNISVPVDSHPKKKNTTLVPLTLIVARYKTGKKLGGFFYLFCSFPKHEMSEEELIEKALRCYRIRWKIEEFYRQVKCTFNWESIQLMTYQTLKTFNSLLMAALSFLYDLETMKLQFAQTCTHLMLESKNKLKELSKFIYYRIADVVSYCFQFITKYHKTMYKHTNQCKRQMELQWL